MEKTITEYSTPVSSAALLKYLTNVNQLIYHDAFLVSQLMYKEDPLAEFQEIQRTSQRYRSIQVHKVAPDTELTDNKPNRSNFGLVEIDYEDCRVVVVAFRGSQFGASLVSSLGHASQYDSNGIIFKEFSQRASQVPLSLLHSHLKNNGRMIVFTGHSLGGAVAQICARNFIYHLESVAEATYSNINQRFLCASFASPVIGDENWRRSINKSYNGHLKNRFVNISHENDLIPCVTTVACNILACAQKSFVTGSSKMEYSAAKCFEDSKVHLTQVLALLSNYSATASATTNLTAYTLSPQDILNMLEFLTSSSGVLQRLSTWPAAGIYLQISQTGFLSTATLSEVLFRKFVVENSATYGTAHSLQHYHTECKYLLGVPKFDNNVVVEKHGPKVLFPIRCAVTSGSLLSTKLPDGRYKMQITLHGSNLLHVVSVSFLRAEFDVYSKQTIFFLENSPRTENKVTFFAEGVCGSRCVELRTTFDVTVVDAFGTEYVLNNHQTAEPKPPNAAVPFHIRCESAGGMYTAEPLKLLKLAATLYILAHEIDEDNLHSILDALDAISQLTLTVPFEIILLPLAMGVPLTDYVVKLLSGKLTHANMRSQVGLQVLSNAITEVAFRIAAAKEELIRFKQNEAKALEENSFREGPDGHHIQLASVFSKSDKGGGSGGYFRSVGSDLDKKEELKMISANVHTSGTVLEQINKVLPKTTTGAQHYESLNHQSSSTTSGPLLTLARRSKSIMQASTLEQDCSEIEGNLANLEAVQAMMTQQISDLCASNESIPLFCKHSLQSVTDSKNQPFMSMRSTIVEMRDKVSAIRHQLVLDLEAETDGETRRHIIEDSEQAVSEVLMHVSTLATLTVGFIEPQKLCDDGVVASRYHTLVRTRRELQWQNWVKVVLSNLSQHKDFAKEVVWSMCMRPFVGQQEQTRHRIAKEENYLNIGVASRLLASYDDTLHFIYGMTTPLTAHLEHLYNAEKEFAVMQFCAKRRITYLSCPANVETEWANIFNLDNSTAGERASDLMFDAIDKRDRYVLSCKLKLILLVERIRSALSSLNVVGFFGTSEAGKSTIVSQLGIADIRHGFSFADRTAFPGFYSYPKNKKYMILDSVGYLLNNVAEGQQQDGDHLSNAVAVMNEDLMELCSVLVIVLPFNCNVLSATEHKIMHLTGANKVKNEHRRILTCFNKIDTVIEEKTRTNRSLGVKQSFLSILNDEVNGRPHYMLNPQLPSAASAVSPLEDVSNVFACTGMRAPRWLTCFRPLDPPVEVEEESESSAVPEFEPKLLRFMRASGVRTIADLEAWIASSMDDNGN